MSYLLQLGFCITITTHSMQILGGGRELEKIGLHPHQSSLRIITKTSKYSTTVLTPYHMFMQTIHAICKITSQGLQ